MVASSGRSKSPRARRCRGNAGCRIGFTLIELLVALVLLDVGILALISASAAAARDESGAQGNARLLEAAASRIERTLATHCGAAASGTARPAPDLLEWWTDAPDANGTREVSDSLVLITGRGKRVLALRSAGRC